MPASTTRAEAWITHCAPSAASTDAFLFYGYCWDEEVDWTDHILRETNEWSRTFALSETAGCSVYEHCSDECSMPFVAVQASLVRSKRGHMNEVKSLQVDPAWNEMLAKFCKSLNIPIDERRPAWWLVSYWS